RRLPTVGGGGFRENGQGGGLIPPGRGPRRGERPAALLWSGAQQRLVALAVEILSDPLGPPAAPIRGRRLVGPQQPLERELERFAGLGIGVRSSDEVHLKSLKAHQAADDRNRG